MTTHDFSEAVKVQRFCLTLVVKARYWYATLEPLVMTWTELQNFFQATVFQNRKYKNTVPNRLYWVLFPIDNLCEAVKTAKRFLTKEKIDRQMTGQRTTPFMKLTEKKKKTVTFDARDALEKTSENMERMTALMDKMYIN